MEYTFEPVNKKLWADGEAVKKFDARSRVPAIYAYTLIGNELYSVFALRTIRKNIVAIAAVKVEGKVVTLLHLGSKQLKKGYGEILIAALIEKYDPYPIKTISEPSAVGFYERIGWRKVGKEHWSK